MNIMTDKHRIIVNDFAETINERKTIGSAPRKTVINFRDDLKNSREREVYDVPLELLRYRKDNGRIASDVLSFERTHTNILDESLQETQNLLFNWLKQKDEKNTEILKKTIIKNGQTEPAIITCDGFLINGNRRKMVLQMLQEQDPTNYKTMKVVILPNVGDEGGSPTVKEIELLENRYQLMKDGKSEYEGLDRAISIRRKIEIGITLEEQLLDDPLNSELKANSPKFNEVVKKCRKDFLHPLEKVDEYLIMINRPGHYALISGKWQSFIDYSNLYNSYLKNNQFTQTNNIKDIEIGKIQDACFKIIRKGSINGIKHKNHEIIREMKNFIVNEEAKAHILKIATEVKDLEPTGNDSLEVLDNERMWGTTNGNAQSFSYNLSNAYTYVNEHKAAETPLSLIRDALKKLKSEKMVLENIKTEDLKEFRKTAEELENDARQLKADSLSEIKRRQR